MDLHALTLAYTDELSLANCRLFWHTARLKNNVGPRTVDAALTHHTDHTHAMHVGMGSFRR